MSILRRTGLVAEPSLVLTGPKVTLRTPRYKDYEEWSRLRLESRAFLMPWEPLWAEDELSRRSFRRRIARIHDDMSDDLAYSFFVFDTKSGALVGGLTISNIRRGVAQMADLGYWAGQRYAGQGFMAAAVRLVLPWLFGTCGFNRINAACLPHNAASIRLLERVGFREEGFAKKYLCINGLWEDHKLYGIARDDVIKGSA